MLCSSANLNAAIRSCVGALVALSLLLYTPGGPFWRDKKPLCGFYALLPCTKVYFCAWAPLGLVKHDGYGKWTSLTVPHPCTVRYCPLDLSSRFPFLVHPFPYQCIPSTAVHWWVVLNRSLSAACTAVTQSIYNLRSVITTENSINSDASARGCSVLRSSLVLYFLGSSAPKFRFALLSKSLSLFLPVIKLKLCNGDTLSLKAFPERTPPPPPPPIFNPPDEDTLQSLAPRKNVLLLPLSLAHLDEDVIGPFTSWGTLGQSLLRHASRLSLTKVSHAYDGRPPLPPIIAPPDEDALDCRTAHHQYLILWELTAFIHGTIRFGLK
jgi:hypothetical protein